MDNYKKLIGKKIQARRIQLGITSQEALGALVGVDQSYVSRWERGLHLPEGKHREKLLEVLNANSSFLDISEKSDVTHKSSEIAQLILEVQDKLKTLTMDQLQNLSEDIDRMKNPVSLEEAPDSLKSIRRVSNNETKD